MSGLNDRLNKLSETRRGGRYTPNDTVNVHSAWNPIASVPSDKPVKLKVQDHLGVYMLPFPCLKHDGSFYNLKTRSKLAVKPVQWKESTE